LSYSYKAGQAAGKDGDNRPGEHRRTSAAALNTDERFNGHADLLRERVDGA
jgi:hypothetical protein